MPNKFEKIIKQTLMTIAIVAAVGVIVVCVLLVLKQFDAVEKTAGLGDVFTAVSIIVAAVITRWSWSRGDRKEGEERERIAKADALILYRRLDILEASALGFLIQSTNQNEKNLLDLFPKSVQKNRPELEMFYRWLVPAVENLRNAVFETHEYLADLRTLYMHDREFGAYFMNAINAIAALRINVNSFTKGSDQSLVRSFGSDQKTQEANFYGLMARAANVAHNLEVCRWVLNHGGEKLPFSVGYCANDIVAFNRCFYEALGQEGPVVGETLSESEYANMLKDVGKYYGAAYTEACKVVHSK